MAINMMSSMMNKGLARSRADRWEEDVAPRFSQGYAEPPSGGQRFNMPPVSPVHSASHGTVPSEYDGDGDQDAWWAVEIENLKSTLKALNVQMFQERKQWLAEKTALEAAASQSSSNGPAMLRRHTIDHTGGGADGAAGHAAQVAALTTERDRAREQVAQLQAEKAQWNIERSSLQRQVDVLMKQGRSRDSEGGAGDIIAQLEEEKAALTSELELIKMSFKNSCVIPKSQMQQALSRNSSYADRNGPTPSSSSGQLGGGGSVLAPATPAQSAPPGSIPATSSSMSNISALNESNQVARLQNEVTRLQAELYILKDECVPVPKGEFASLKGVHTERAALEQEVKSLRGELADTQRLAKMLREEMELIREEHVPITMQEYDDLRRAMAEKEALEMKQQAQAKYYAQVPREELAELQAARRTAAALEAQLAAFKANGEAAGASEQSKALQKAHEDLALLRIKLMETEATLAEVRRELAGAEGRAQGASALQERIKSLEATVASTQQERGRHALQLRSLEEQVAALKQELEEARRESLRIATELGESRDTISSLRQETSRLSRERGELDSRCNDLKAERATLTHELVDAKLELARLREMEVIYKKHVVHNKVQMYGLPGDAAAAVS